MPTSKRPTDPGLMLDRIVQKLARLQRLDPDSGAMLWLEQAIDLLINVSRRRQRAAKGAA